MKTKKELIEEKIKSEIENDEEIIEYCATYTINIPYPGFIHPIGFLVLSILGATVSIVFIILLGAFVIFMIIMFIMYYEKYILIFLKNNIKLLQVKGDNLNIINAHTYSYNNVKSVETKGVGLKSFSITFLNAKERTLIFQVKSNNSSFTLKDFDVKKFCIEKKTEINNN